LEVLGTDFLKSEKRKKSGNKDLEVLETDFFKKTKEKKSGDKDLEVLRSVRKILCMVT
jgi:hypothetical protein